MSDKRFIDRVIELFTADEFDESDFDLKKDVSLDKYTLDDESDNHAENVRKWGKLLAEAQYIASKCKEVMETTLAELQIEARNGGMEGKPTVDAVNAWVKSHPKYVKAYKRKIKAEAAVEFLKSGVKAMEHKKHMILNESNLWMCGYFARPHIPTDAVEAMEHEGRKKATQKLKDK